MYLRIFQEYMSTLMEDLEYARTFIDDIFVLSRGRLSEHLTDVETVLVRLQKSN